MNQYNTEKEIESKKQEDKYNMFSQDLRRISSESKTLSKQSEINKKEILETSNRMQDLRALNKSNIEDNIKTREALQRIALEKEAASKQNESDRMEALKMNEKLAELIIEMKAEITARKLFSADLQEKYTKLENELKLMKIKS